jgi:hypothetical protein
MDYLFDEFSKSLVESVPRRESLRRLGAVFAGAVLGPLGLETAWARGPDPCKAFCKCGNKAQQTKCLAACKTCNSDTKRIAGSCGTHTCCSTALCSGKCSDLKSDPNCGACGNNCSGLGKTCCGNYCADLAHDVFNCGRCGTVCAPPDPYEYVACAAGRCLYDCVAGADDCGDGTCTHLGFDPGNCGACGNVCAEPTPYCNAGECSAYPPGFALCKGHITNLDLDNANCGACGVVCPDGYSCQGVCQPIEPYNSDGTYF